MKQLYHFCITCHGEVLFRDDEDIRCVTNILALEAFGCHIELWADAVMSTHLHGIVFGEEGDAVRFCRNLKMRLTKYHRNRHRGAGPLFDPGFFLLPLEGSNHILAAVSYVLRNGLHHGQSATPFSYPYCSANHLFCKELGKTPEKAAITSRRDIARLLPRRSEFPDHFAMDRSGMLIRCSFEQLARVEHCYRTPRCFAYFMSRLSGEEWQREQREDAVREDPVTLASIEPACRHESLARMLASEKGFGYSPGQWSDMDLCRLIDTEYVGSYSRTSVYQLSVGQRSRIADDVAHRLRVPPAQVMRCLALK